MSDISKNIKEIWIKGIETIGNAASNVANNTKYKVNEMNLINNRRELLNGIGEKAYELWKNGETCFPEELIQIMMEIAQLETQLEQLRMEKMNPKVTETDLSLTQKESLQKSEEEFVEKTGFVKTESSLTGKETITPVTEMESETIDPCPLSDVINNLFEGKPTVEDMAGKMNHALDSFGDSLSMFGNDLTMKVEKMMSDINNHGSD